MKHDLVEDIRNSPEIMAKIRADDRSYAQNLYAAWCNMQWCKRETWPILAEEYWTASWRGAGGIVADLRNKGEDYMDYYCTGIREVSYDEEENKTWDTLGYASEGEVKERIEKDLSSIGWFPVPYKDQDLV